MLERDGYQCTYCPNEADTVDHVIAKDNGGEDVEENLVAACRTCNGRKGARTLVRQTWWNTRWLTSINK